MKDTIPKGTHNSRSILGAQEIPETWPEALAMLKSTGWPIDLGPLNPLGVLQMGTGYTKPEVLSDETAALYGKDDTATVDDILAAIPPSISASTAALRTYQKFTTSGTWTPPDDMEGDEIFVVMVGGGGGGGGGGARGGGSYGGYGGHGGQGGSGYIKIFSARVDKETAYRFTIGAGGTEAPVFGRKQYGRQRR